MSLLLLSKTYLRSVSLTSRKLPENVLQIKRTIKFSWFNKNKDKKSDSKDLEVHKDGSSSSEIDYEELNKHIALTESILKDLQDISKTLKKNGIKEIDSSNEANTIKIELDNLDDKSSPLEKLSKTVSKQSINFSQLPKGYWTPENPPIFSQDPIPYITESKYVPVFTICKTPLMSNYITTLQVVDPKVISKIEYLKDHNINNIALFLDKKSDNSAYTDYKIDDLQNMKSVYSIGCYAQILDIKQDGNAYSVTVVGKQNVLLDSIITYSPQSNGVIMPYYNGLIDITQTQYNRFQSDIQELIQHHTKNNFDLNLLFTQLQQAFQANVPDNLLLLAFLCINGYGRIKQEIICKKSLKDQLETCISLLKEYEVLQTYRQKMDREIMQTRVDQQRKATLNEELIYIKKELGLDADQKQIVIKKYKEKYDHFKSIHVNPSVLVKMDEEMNKLQYMDEHNAEYSYVRNYLDWVCNVPWNIIRQDQLDLKQARTILDEDHYGLKDVKQRILEFIAVGKLCESINGKVLCLVGPPGVGKTSIAKSIARALNREYYQFSVGGLTDVSQIKGHRRTYIGSMPGKLVEALKTVKISNPLILIDEIDKIKQGYNGDPSAALLEVLDPSQNSQFMDNYLDLPLDLSKCLFICTANDMNSIPDPLRDRMEILEMHGYDPVEKLNIAKNYLDKKARIETGFENANKSVKVPSSLSISDDTFNLLIKYYCREAGVRNLQKYIEKIYRNIALKISEEPTKIDSTSWLVTPSTVETYIGKPLFVSDRLYDITPPGVVMGLAWTSMGGSTLYLECNAVNKHPLDINSKQWEITSSYIPTITSPMTKNNASNSDSSTSSISSVNETKNSQIPAYTGHLSITGQLGNVMKESTDLAYINARHWMQVLKYNDLLYNHIIQQYSKQYEQSYHKQCVTFPSRDDIFNYLEYSNIHLHFPEGAVPKDGPSAGCTITCSLLSKALNRSLKQDLAMTGEISLNGKILPVGGIKEKVLAAKRANVHTIIVPKENTKDVDELPDYNKEGITFYYASTFEDVLRYSGLCDEIFEN